MPAHVGPCRHEQRHTFRFGVFCTSCAPNNLCSRSCGNAVFFLSSGLCKPCGTAAEVPDAENSPVGTSIFPNLMAEAPARAHKKKCACSDVSCYHAGSVCGMEMRPDVSQFEAVIERAKQAGKEYDYDRCADCNSFLLGLQAGGGKRSSHLCTCAGSVQGCPEHEGYCGRSRLNGYRTTVCLRCLPHELIWQCRPLGCRYVVLPPAHYNDTICELLHVTSPPSLEPSLGADALRYRPLKDQALSLAKLCKDIRYLYND